MEITAYIKELLVENDYVIIPGLGAFVAGYKPAHTDDTQESILPPSKEVTFNRKLKNNDGLLVGTIASEEGISRFDALKKVEEFRENIQYRIKAMNCSSFRKKILICWLIHMD